jgi:hypothetical protein
MVPTAELPAVTPSTDQVTAVFVDPVTVALNCVVHPTGTLAVVWFSETVTVGGGGEPLFEEFDPHASNARVAVNTQNLRQSVRLARFISCRVVFVIFVKQMFVAILRWVCANAALAEVGQVLSVLL